MKAIISKILVAGTIIIGLSLSAQAAAPYQTKKDTGKMSKIDKKMDKKMDKMDSKMDKKMDSKMDKKMMKKDTGKMKKM
jgi:uncharacterized protein involved in copper resistance